MYGDSHVHTRLQLYLDTPQPSLPGGGLWSHQEGLGWSPPRHPLTLARFPAHLSAAPRSCIIDKEELKDGLRVLIPLDDKLLYAGHVQTVHSPDM